MRRATPLHPHTTSRRAQTTFFPRGATAQLWPRPPHCCVSISLSLSHTHTHTHMVGLLWTSDQLVAEADTHSTQNRRTSMPSAGFEPAIPAIDRSQTHALKRAATGIGYAQHSVIYYHINSWHKISSKTFVVFLKGTKHKHVKTFSSLSCVALYDCVRGKARKVSGCNTTERV
jgi:hypothetical protein